MSLKRSRSRSSSRTRPRDLILSAIYVLSKEEHRAPNASRICTFLAEEWGVRSKKIREEVTTSLKQAVEFGFVKKERDTYCLEGFVDNYFVTHREGRHRPPAQKDEGARRDKGFSGTIFAGIGNDMTAGPSSVTGPSVFTDLFPKLEKPDPEEPRPCARNEVRLDPTVADDSNSDDEIKDLRPFDESPSKDIYS